MAIVHTVRGEMVDGTVEAAGYMADVTRGGRVVAVLFSDYVQWEPDSFEGPRPLRRSFELVIVTHEGEVVRLTTRTEQVMSDCWEDVTYAWVKSATGGYKEVHAGQHRGVPGVDVAPSAADAPEAIVADHAAWTALENEWSRRTQARRAARRRREEERAEAREPKKGRKVKVARGRKVKIGTEGEVIWYGHGRKYGWYGRPPMRVGIKLASGEVVWVDAANVEVVGAPPAQREGAVTLDTLHRIWDGAQAA